MSDIREMKFRRKFSLTMYKNKKLKLGEMSFFKDFINDKRGDLYPVLEKDGKFTETVSSGKYTFLSQSDAHIIRLIGEHFPYANYAFTAEKLDGSCGFSFFSPNARADILFCVKNGKIVCSYGSKNVHTDKIFVPETEFIVNARKNNFDVYINNDGFTEYICTFSPEGFENIVCYDVFTKTTASLYISGNTVLRSVEFYMDCGLSQADIRPIRYENGDIMVVEGKIYLTMSIRLHEEMYQGVFSWVPGTAEFELTGAIFFDCGDGRWENDVASSILFNREKNMWYIWVCSFSHGHILGHGVSCGDVRFGINVVDITLMDKMTPKSSDTEFLAKENDEDPDFIYDEKSKKWIMTVCRLVKDGNSSNYRYFLFESDNPFEGYRYIANTISGAETGGSIVPTDNGKYFVCGSDFDKRAQYHIYKLPDMSEYTQIKCNFDDGGFRGWGTVMPIKKGSRTYFYWITFDRHNSSSYTWSYGNIYVFEA